MLVAVHYREYKYGLLPSQSQLQLLLLREIPVIPAVAIRNINFKFSTELIKYKSRGGTSEFRLRFRLTTFDFWLPTSDFQLPTSDFRLPTSDFRLQTSDLSCGVRSWIQKGQQADRPVIQLSVCIPSFQVRCHVLASRRFQPSVVRSPFVEFVRCA